MSAPMLDDVLRICSPELRDEILSLRAQLADATQRAEKAKQDAEFNLCCTAQAISERDAARARIAELAKLLQSLTGYFDKGHLVHKLVGDALAPSPAAKGDAPECHTGPLGPCDLHPVQPDAERPSDATIQKVREGKVLSDVEASELAVEVLKLRAQLAKQDDGERRTWFDREYRFKDPHSWFNASKGHRPATEQEAREVAQWVTSDHIEEWRTVEVTMVRRVLSGAGSEGSNG